MYMYLSKIMFVADNSINSVIIINSEESDNYLKYRAGKTPQSVQSITQHFFFFGKNKIEASVHALVLNPP